MSKGSTRRPSSVDTTEFDRKWSATFDRPDPIERHHSCTIPEFNPMMGDVCDLCWEESIAALTKRMEERAFRDAHLEQIAGIF